MTATEIEVEYTRPWLYPKQTEALFAPERYSIIEASTKSGKTVGCIVWLFEQAYEFGKAGRNYWWVAPTTDVANIAYRRMKRGIPRALYHANETLRTITLANGAVIWFKGSERPDLLYGEDVFACVVDEASRVKADAWTAVRSTVTATKGRLRIIGNVRGKHNWAYRMARQAEQGAPNMAYFRLTAKDAIAAGIFDDAELADAKRVLTPEAFQELYFAEAADDGSNPFGWDAIKACTVGGDAPSSAGSLSLAIAGGPRTGKSTVAQSLRPFGYAIRATDSLIKTHEWSQASEEASRWFGIGQVIEGVAVGRALRKWLHSHPTGKPCDVILSLTTPHTALSDGQETMAKGCATVWGEIVGSLMERGVEIVETVDALLDRLRLSSRQPIQNKEPAMCYGWDFARAQDWTVGIGLDKHYRVTALHRWQQLPWDEQYRKVNQANGATPAWGDSTGIGDVIVEALQRQGVPMIGVPFSQPMKQKLMEVLRSAIQQKKLQIPEGPIIDELESFEYTYVGGDQGRVRYSAPDGLHDDCVMALALAVYGRDQFGVIADPALKPFNEHKHPGLDTEAKTRKSWYEPDPPSGQSKWLPSKEIVRI